ncbi:MAG: hypothetical protein K0R46_414 [Herbinix sp.]|nr:hypothetical protein [Herbinix sp.]
MSDSLNIKQNYKDAILCDKDIVYFDDILQALCKWDIENNRVTIIMKYDGEIFTSFRIFRGENCIYITSAKNADILIYDENEGSFLLKSHTFKNNLKVIVTQACMLNRNIWILYQQAAKAPIIHYDIDRGQFVEQEFLLNYLHEREAWLPFASSNSGCFWATVHGTNHYLKIDPLKEHVEEYTLEDQYTKLASMYSDNQNNVFTMLDSKKLIINGNTYSMMTDEHSVKENYSYCIGLSECVVILPRFGNEIAIFGKNTKSVSIVRPNWGSIPECDFYGISKVVGCYENYGYIYLCPQNISVIVRINKDTLQTDLIMPKFSAEIYMRTLYKRKNPRYMFILEKNFGDKNTALNALLSCVEEVDSTEKEKQKTVYSYGEQIHNSILGEMR